MNVCITYFLIYIFSEIVFLSHKVFIIFKYYYLYSFFDNSMQFVVPVTHNKYAYTLFSYIMHSWLSENDVRSPFDWRAYSRITIKTNKKMEFQNMTRVWRREDEEDSNKCLKIILNKLKVLHATRRYKDQ